MSTRVRKQLRVPVETFDFSQLYTNMDQNEIIAMHRAKIQWVKEELQKCNVSKDGVTPHGQAKRQQYPSKLKYQIDPVTLTYTVQWTNESKKNSPTLLIIDLDEYLELYASTIKNFYFTWNGSLFLQVNGIIMGAESSVLTANGSMSGYEFEWLVHLIEAKAWNVLASARHCKRHIDDLLTMGFPNFTKFFYREQMSLTIFPNTQVHGIYPGNQLTLNKEHSLWGEGKRQTPVIFLDSQVAQSVQTGLLMHKLFDKRVLQRFDRTPINRLPANESLIPSQSKEGIIRSELHRIYTVSSHTDFFCSAVGHTITEMIIKGYDVTIVYEHLRKFLQQRITLHRGMKRDVHLYATGKYSRKKITKQITRWVLHYIRHGSPVLYTRMKQLNANHVYPFIVPQFKTNLKSQPEPRPLDPQTWNAWPKKQN